MADAVVAPAAAPAAAPTPAAAPVAAPAPAAAAPASAPAAAPVAAPAATPAAAPTAAPAPAAAAPAAAPAPGIKFGDDPADPADPAAAPAAAPAEASTYDLKLPEGMTLADEALSGVKARFAAANVPPDQAQALFDAHLDGIRAATETAQKAVLDSWAATKAEWEAEIAADPEIGGAKQAESLSQISKGVDTLLGAKAGKAFRAALDATGAGSNPAIVRGLFKAFSQHAPARTETGNPPSSNAPRTAGQIIYGSTQPRLGNAAP